MLQCHGEYAETVKDSRFSLPIDTGIRIWSQLSFVGTTSLPSQSTRIPLARTHRWSPVALNASGTTLSTWHGIAKTDASALSQPNTWRIKIGNTTQRKISQDLTVGMSLVNSKTHRKAFRGRGFGTESTNWVMDEGFEGNVLATDGHSLAHSTSAWTDSLNLGPGRLLDTTHFSVSNGWGIVW